MQSYRLIKIAATMPLYIILPARGGQLRVTHFGTDFPLTERQINVYVSILYCVLYYGMNLIYDVTIWYSRSLTDLSISGTDIMKRQIVPPATLPCNPALQREL
jgi:hypothetical protein